MIANVDYVAISFKYRTPTPINGKPTNKTLKQIKTLLQANISIRDTDIGGNHGYLGLVLSDAKYVRITPTRIAFLALNFRSTLMIDALTTIVEAVHA